MLAILLIFLLVLETYVFFGLKSNFEGNIQTLVLGIDIFMLLITISAFVSVFVYYDKGLSITKGWINILLGLSITFVITKIIYVLPLLFEDVYRGGKFLIQYLSSSGEVDVESRRKFVSNSALIIASIPFSSFLYGVFVGRYNFKVFNQKLSFPDLPKAFNGFKIVQISDIHSGSFDSKEAMQKGLNLLMSQKPDLILFTGDLVNNLSEEFDPYIEMFMELKAPFGKYSVLGNHDYGLYRKWESEEKKEANFQRIKNHHKSIGFDLLNNTNKIIEKDGQKIRLVGVENWGRPPFPPHGDLDKALEGTMDKEFTILMSHDPHHWDDVVLKNPKHIHLTLSGHTHGMQMGIDLPGFKWSPSSLRYKRWAGLYQELNQYIYVNRGFGHIGFPGRVGIMPEITVLELQKHND